MRLIKRNDIKAFRELARKLQECYPEGNKPDTPYSWRSSTEEIALRLRTLVVTYGFEFNEEEAIEATKQYIESFDDYKYIKLLKNFLLKTTIDSQGNNEIDSMFITIIENNRDEDNN